MPVSLRASAPLSTGTPPEPLDLLESALASGRPAPDPPSIEPPEPELDPADELGPAPDPEPDVALGPPPELEPVALPDDELDTTALPLDPELFDDPELEGKFAPKGEGVVVDEQALWIIAPAAIARKPEGCNMFIVELDFGRPAMVKSSLRGLGSPHDHSQSLQQMHF